LTSPPIELSGVFAKRYALEAEIGRGGSSIVYQARDTASGGRVAIKLLRPELVASIGAARFLTEVRFLAALAHPGIIPVIDSGEIDGRLFVVLPYLEHGTLRARLTREKQLPLPDAVAIARALCVALQFAHERGVVHRDVKPENILFSEEGPCLADFGIARAIERSMGETFTTTGVVLGTPAYMSPEQAAGEYELDGRTDVYSLGCVLYEMISGMQAFTGPNRQSVISQRLVYGPRPLRIYRPAVPPALEAVVEKALMAMPADRFQSAAELDAALASVPHTPTMPEDLESGASSPDLGAYALTLRRRRIRRGLVGGGFAALIAAGWYVASMAREGPLDANRVVVFPLVERGEVRSGSAIGDEVALLIGTAFEHTEPLRWIDGWTWLDSTQRANPALLSASQARRIARDRGARFYLDGSVLARRDSVTVVTRLMDVDGDTVFAQNSATGATTRELSPVLGLRAVIPLLPRLVDPSRKVDLRPLLDRRPAAIASFLQGERDYRQSRFVEALSQYRRAVEADSNLAFAAIKGAQAASWVDLTSEGHALIGVALAHEALLPLTSEVAMPNKKKKKSKSPGATVSHAQLVKQVRLLTIWVRVLKGNANMGGWTLGMAKSKYKPDPAGGPPGL
jgi:serine/threonine-protein kinase